MFDLIIGLVFLFILSNAICIFSGVISLLILNILQILRGEK
jgi:hypothetical protein